MGVYGFVSVIVRVEFCGKIFYKFFGFKKVYYLKNWYFLEFFNIIVISEDVLKFILDMYNLFKLLKVVIIINEYCDIYGYDFIGLVME